MTEKPHSPVPEPIKQLQEQLDQFRLAHPRRSKLPEAVWEAAVALARQHGIYAVAHPLRLDYVGLKKRLAGVSRGARNAGKAATAKAAFVELAPPRRPAIEECMIEFESALGRKMRIPWSAIEERDWTKLLRAWRETEG
jgi:hypothetical protein